MSGGQALYCTDVPVFTDYSDRVTLSRVHRPSLRALMAFEAAARLGSFGAAALEMHLTPSAVSHQIAGLEALLGVELFIREGRGIRLEPNAARYLERVRQILASLDRAGWELVNATASARVTIHTPPSIVSGWLLPLLTVFRQAHPSIRIRVNAEPRRAGIDWDEIDLAIQYKEPSGRRKNELPLLEERVQPMCSPQILHDKPVRLPQDLLEHVLIHSRYNSVSWKDWFLAHQVSDLPGHERIEIDPSHVAIQAAAKGMGIVLESDILARESIASGGLVTPLPDCAIHRNSYVLVWSANKNLSESALLFRDWLVEMASQHDPEHQP